MNPIIIAIDGHSSSGKSSFAKSIAAKLHYTYIDSGAMYRAVTLHALRSGLIDEQGKVDSVRLIAGLPQIRILFRYNEATQKSEVLLNGENVEREIRLLPVSNNVSRVSEIPQVRQILVRLQQRMGEQKSIVMDGRDIGTAVFPTAELKIFLTASPEIRAQRRYQELLDKGETADYAAIEKNIRERDFIDEHRETDPLRKAEDAVVLDNSHLSPAQQMTWVMERIENIVKG